MVSAPSISHPRLPPLRPTGTARGLFLGPAVASDTGGEDAGGSFPNDLGALLSARDVTDANLWAAWEVTTWASDAPAADRRALACLVVALLDAITAGGTFLPLDGAGAPASVPSRAHGTGALADHLRRLGLGEADRAAVVALAAALIAGTAPPAIAALVGTPGARRPFILSDGALYAERYWYLEDRLVTALRARMTARVPGLPTISTPVAGRAEFQVSPLDCVDDAIAALSTTNGMPPLDPDQLAAVRSALTNPVTIIAGGPGTGKTSTIVGVMRALARLGVPADAIALGAPTGRAAGRMTEALNLALARLEGAAPADVDLISRFVGATTLHRLLGIRPGRLRVLEPEAPTYYADWPLPHRFVIVDEASMIDLGTMDLLISAIGPDTRLLLIGDVDQLPSVQVGAVFRDLVAGVPTITHRLTRSHRVNPLDPDGAEILRIARSANAGTVATAPQPPFARASELTFRGFEQLGPRALDAFLERWHREILGADANVPLALQRRFTVDDAHRIIFTDFPDGASTQPRPDDAAVLKTLLEAQISARILCVTREAGRATSAAALNRLMHARVQAAATALAPADSWETAPFLPGEPVIVQRNDHARGLANGDLGVVLRVRNARGDGLGVAFPRAEGCVVHRLDAIGGALDLAFALTVHKAQGSEYDRVALILPEVDVPLLTREVVYTALTRARHSVVVLGDPLFFSLAASRPLVRTSGIGKKLAPRGLAGAR